VFALAELESSIVLTLRCMGNLYRQLYDPTNAIGCHLKAIELLKEKLKRMATETSIALYQGTDGDLGFGKGTGETTLTLPLPKIILEEMRSGDKVMDTAELSKSALSEVESADSREQSKLRKEIASLYSTVVTLVNDRKQLSGPVKIASGRSGYASSSSYSSAASSIISRQHETSRLKKFVMKIQCLC
jgi:hypothetical protein